MPARQIVVLLVLGKRSPGLYGVAWLFTRTQGWNARPRDGTIRRNELRPAKLLLEENVGWHCQYGKVKGRGGMEVA